LYLIALGAWGLHRGVLGALIAITAVALVALLALPWVRMEVWGTDQDTSGGLVSKHVLPWLRDSWWGGLAVLGGIILLAVLFSLIPRRRPKPNRAKTRPAMPPLPSIRMGAQTSIAGLVSAGPDMTGAGSDGDNTADPHRPSLWRHPVLRWRGRARRR
jgi:hypothetical protein